jgi:uncharacterized membrane protein ArfC
MNNVNWWLTAVAFPLGLRLTCAFTIRRVRREVPVYAALGAGLAADAPSVKSPHLSAPDVDVKRPHVSASDAPTVQVPLVSAPDVDVKRPFVSASDAPTAEVPLVSAPDLGAKGSDVSAPDVDVKAPHVTGGELAAGAAAVAGGAAAAKSSGAKASAASEEPYGAGSLRFTGADAPKGYTIKGNEDSMLYHTPESPSYKQTIAEVWFNDEETAAKAGFTRWDKGRRSRK